MANPQERESKMQQKPAHLRELNFAEAHELYQAFPEQPVIHDQRIRVFVVCDDSGCPMALFSSREVALLEAAERGISVDQCAPRSG
jgi:hypothetical protein